MQSNMRRLIAFAGYAGAGKDEAAIPLIDQGFVKSNFGDIIKRQLDHLCFLNLGFSAFTEDRKQKERIRPLLEQWGEANYDNIFKEYLGAIDNNRTTSFVNTRIVRVREAEEWVKRGGEIWLVERDRILPATQWEEDRLCELVDSGLITKTIFNDGDIHLLHNLVLSALLGQSFTPVKLELSTSVKE